MDLANVFDYHLAEHEEDMNTSVVIYNTHLKIWNKDADQIRQLADQNTPGLLPPAIVGMKELINEMAKRLRLPGIAEEDFPMYVLSNEQRVNGAATLAYPGVLRHFAETMQKNLYVIPSSIHELILVAEYGDMQDLSNFVRQVNRKELDPKDVLADHVYFYDLKEDQLLAIP